MTNENRVPAGSPEGGQWTKGSSAETEGVSLATFDGFDEFDEELESTGFAEGVDLDALSRRSVHIRYAAASNTDPASGNALHYAGLAPRDYNPLGDGQTPYGLSELGGVYDWKREHPAGKISELEAVYFQEENSDAWRYGAVEKKTGKLVALADYESPLDDNPNDPDDVRDFKSKSASILDRRTMKQMTPGGQVVYARAAMSPSTHVWRPSAESADKLAALGYTEHDDIEAAFATGINSAQGPDWEPERARMFHEHVAQVAGNRKNSQAYDNALKNSQDVRAVIEQANIEDLRSLRDSESYGKADIIALTDPEKAGRIRQGAKLGLRPDEVNSDHDFAELAELKKSGGIRGERLVEAADRGWNAKNAARWSKTPDAFRMSPDELQETGMTPAQFARYQRAGGAIERPDRMKALASIPDATKDDKKMRTWNRAIDQIESSTGDFVNPQALRESGASATQISAWQNDSMLDIKHTDDLKAMSRLSRRGIDNSWAVMNQTDPNVHVSRDELRQISTSPAPIRRLADILDARDAEIANTPAREMPSAPW